MMTLADIDTLWNKTPESVNKYIESALNEINTGTELYRLGLRVIAHKSYGRVYLRWQQKSNKDRKANFKDFNIELTLTQDLALTLCQAKIDRLNAQIAFHAKQLKHSNHSKPT